jgi:hypothetical protein
MTDAKPQNYIAALDGPLLCQCGGVGQITEYVDASP